MKEDNGPRMPNPHKELRCSSLQEEQASSNSPSPCLLDGAAGIDNYVYSWMGIIVIDDDNDERTTTTRHSSRICESFRCLVLLLLMCENDNHVASWDHDDIDPVWNYCTYGAKRNEQKNIHYEGD